MLKKLLNGKFNLLPTFTAVLFAILLWAPLLQSWLKIFPDQIASEKRLLEKSPELKNLSFEEAFELMGKYEKYYSDNFGFRGMLISMNNFFRVKYLKVLNPMPKVINGKEGWLFYNDPNDGVSIPDYCGLAPFSQKLLERIQQKVVNLSATLKEKGAQLLIVVAPNKHTIYPEYLPPIELRKPECTRLDQLLDYLAKHHCDVPVLDLRKPLQLAKARMPVYYKNDTHWNNFGAFTAYTEIMRFLSKRLNVQPPASLSDFDMNVHATNRTGDLAAMLSMSESFEEAVVEMAPKNRLAVVKEITIPGEKAVARQTYMAEVSSSGLPRLLMFQDSFGRLLMHFLSEHFSKSLYLSYSDLPETDKWIDREKPDIVIIEVVERNLEHLDMINP
jgi:hypothetical protein